MMLHCMVQIYWLFHNVDECIDWGGCIKKCVAENLKKLSSMMQWGKWQLPDSFESPVSRSKIGTLFINKLFHLLLIPIYTHSLPLSLLVSNWSITYRHTHQCQAHFTVRPQPPLCVAGGQRSLYCYVNTGTQAHTLHLINGLRTLDMTAQPSLQDPAAHSAKDCSVLPRLTFSLLPYCPYKKKN